ncbi:MAG TPA: PDZ domain-containing protein [Steroidobacter sp.]
MDRRRSLVMRGSSLAGAVVLTIAALWGAGLPPTQWWAWVKGKESQPVETSARTPSASATTPLATLPAAITPASNLPPGTDSSLSIERHALFLVATSPGRNEHEGTAKIGTNPDNPQTYVAGALLANGARLTEIHRDHVVIARGDASAQLPLYSRTNVMAPPSVELLSVGGERQSPVSVAVTRDVLTDYIRPSPVYDGESLLGYQVYSGKKSGVFAQLGLQAGDVIVAINDVTLSDPQQAMELFNV